MVNLSRFEEKLANGEIVIGPFSKTSDASMVEAMGYAGFDFIIIDLEHGPNSILNAQHLVRAAEISHTFPIIRVPELNPSHIGKALDIGAKGVQVPQITNAEEAARAISYAKFGPQGERGVCRFVRAANFSDKDRFEYFEQANKSFVILQLEGTEAIQNLEEIINVAGIDIAFIGPYDLSQSLGVPGQVTHEVVIEKMTEIIDKCLKKNIVVGVFTDQLESARYWKNVGVKYISYSVDVGIIQEASKTIIAAIH
ncbi:HpcH/HpaI aldolase family protein [Sphingobacterium arenae]|uniref:Aldolase n=1 Tax=Sphingobacterium arenae TaxID=1280598 RepID=A0ABR7Y5E3_9SPHI|nr:aldolase/citrate lyase family protein [Sphingobacterium arenae]MBD1426502.1 aldolase [Sphingobacterium arenae]